MRFRYAVVMLCLLAGCGSNVREAAQDGFLNGISNAVASFISDLLLSLAPVVG